ncbi:hypothetical protein ASAP_2128 [Asaia bogorensis]|uniref:Uncharacterized protein n=1 Tax=Asaia bogorensis TaxID=91915 RepID=A0A060QHM3_9PROT|nr:hypothetical protein P792_11110 [Asaia sp. SF2.1]CDG40173.1 hypothetical protein ASAP_2128 [Asaia bogorensis]
MSNVALPQKASYDATGPHHAVGAGSGYAWVKYHVSPQGLAIPHETSHPCVISFRKMDLPE